MSSFFRKVWNLMSSVFVCLKPSALPRTQVSDANVAQAGDRWRWVSWKENIQGITQ